MYMHTSFQKGLRSFEVALVRNENETQFLTLILRIYATICYLNGTKPIVCLSYVKLVSPTTVNILFQYHEPYLTLIYSLCQRNTLL